MVPISYDDLVKRRRGRSPGGSPYRRLVEELRPGEVAEWTLDIEKDLEGQRSAMHDAARRAGVRIITSIEGGTMYVGLAPHEGAASTKPESRTRRPRNEKSPG